MEAKGKLPKKTVKLLFFSLMIVSMVAVSSPAYAQITWLAYDDFSSEAKSVRLWSLSNTNMCHYYLPDFLGGKMIQEAWVGWFDYSCYTNSNQQNRVRAKANPTVAPYINGLAATVKIDELYNYNFEPREVPPESNYWVNQNNVRTRLAAVFFNDGRYDNSENGQDLTSDIYATIDIRENDVRWSVVRFKDPLGFNTDFLGGGSLLNPWGLYDPAVTWGFRGIPLTLKLWFDGKKIYFSVQARKSSQDIIEVAGSYTPNPALSILPQKSTPFKQIETLIDVAYLTPYQRIDDWKDGEDSSRIKAEWDNVTVAVDQANLTTVKRIIRDASR